MLRCHRNTLLLIFLARQLHHNRMLLKGIFVWCAVPTSLTRLNLCSTWVRTSGNHTRSKLLLSIRAANKAAIRQLPNWLLADSSILRDSAARTSSYRDIVHRRSVSYHSTIFRLHFVRDFCMARYRVYCDRNVLRRLVNVEDTRWYNWVYWRDG